MKIYTQTGDRGETSLVGGIRVSKNHPRVEAYGKIDELISHIAYLRSLTEDLPTAVQENLTKDKALLREIQISLMSAAAQAACEAESSRKIPSFDNSCIKVLEENIDRIQSLLPSLHYFVLPSPPSAAAYCHIVRTVCREAERRCIPLLEQGLDSSIIAFLNRLSDYLFVLARFLCKEQNLEEDLWIP